VELQRGLARNLVALLGAALFLLALFAAPAGATPTWLPAHPLSVQSEDELEPQIATGADGNAVAVWQRQIGGSRAIETSVHSAAGGWSGPIRLSGEAGNADRPQVVIDPSGTATAIWDHSNGSFRVIEAATHPAGGSWSAPSVLSDGTENAFFPQVAVDASGNLVATWETVTGVTSAIEAATRPAGGSWSTATRLSDHEHEARQPRVAIDPSGNAVVTWQLIENFAFVEVADHPAGGGWSSARRLSGKGQNGSEPQVAIGLGGVAAVVWQAETIEGELIEAATRAPGGPWSDPSGISQLGVVDAIHDQDAIEPQIAADPTGGVVAVWARWDGAHMLIETAAHPEGGPWSAASTLSNPGREGFVPQVVVDPSGNITAAWEGSDLTNFEIETVTHPAGGSWSTPSRISDPARKAFEPQLAVSPEGDVVAVWQSLDNQRLIAVETTVYDRTAPKLSASIPASGRAGAALSFSATASDAWSSLGAISWSFGDRGSAGGLAATHTFAKPGVYQVTLTVGDAVGNAATKTQAVTIGPPLNVRAIAAPLIKVVKGRALLKLSCPAVGPCQGAAKLGLKQTVKHGKKRAKKLVTIAHGRVNLRPGAHATVKLKLSAKATHLLAAAGKRGLRATLSGSAVKGRSVRLVASQKKRKKRKRG
jgi:hypothetical protein